MDTFEKAVLGICAAAALVVFRALCITVLWDWFVVPLGVVEIGMAHAYGLCLVVSMFSCSDNDTEDVNAAIIKGFAQVAVIMAFAYAAHLVMS